MVISYKLGFLISFHEFADLLLRMILCHLGTTFYFLLFRWDVYLLMSDSNGR